MNKVKMRLSVRYNSPWAFARWMIDAGKIFAEAPLRFLAISGFWLGIFVLFLAGGTFLQSNFGLALLAAAILSLVFPLTLASLTLAYVAQRDGQRAGFYLLLCGLLCGSNLRLIIVYALLAVLLSLGSGYLSYRLPELANLTSILAEGALVLLQLLILIALPANILREGRLQPFHALWFALKAFIINFIPCLLLIVLMFGILFAAIFLAKTLAVYWGKVTLLFYILELWLFICGLGLASAVMVSRLFHEMTLKSASN